MGEELEFAGLRQLREKYESDEAQADPAFGGDIVLEVEYFRALRGAALSLLDTAEKAERVERERDEARQCAERLKGELETLAVRMRSTRSQWDPARYKVIETWATMADHAALAALAADPPAEAGGEEN